MNKILEIFRRISKYEEGDQSRINLNKRKNYFSPLLNIKQTEIHIAEL
jgi:hypothetical protein